jgi:hypothetical protein
VFEQRAEHGQEVQVDASRARHGIPFAAIGQISTYPHLNRIISAND